MHSFIVEVKKKLFSILGNLLNSGSFDDFP